ncbi:alpha 1,2-mannosyltransferase 2.4.1 [Lambiella insularis]|nr:alpha 1,2-mannosyltransferase 2.4.1 [Lambiella insularis]
MCRFFSGFFFRHELLAKYDYYWRVEPETELSCDIDFDPFQFMKDNGKIYSFVIGITELPGTIKLLWSTIKSFVKTDPDHLVKGNSLGFLSDDQGQTYNGCHFWSNSEIGSLNWLRSQQYLDLFNFLDKEGGFFYERWGDAPVHTIATSLMLKKQEIHFFNQIAYYHPPFMHCLTGEPLKRDLKSHCSEGQNFNWMEWPPQILHLHQLPLPSGYEEELPLVADLADRLVADDELTVAESIAEIDGREQAESMAVEAGSVRGQHSLHEYRNHGPSELRSLRAENVVWKWIVSSMSQSQNSMRKQSFTKGGLRPMRKRDTSI